MTVLLSEPGFFRKRTQPGIPLVDISSCHHRDNRSTADTARELAAAFHDIGFVYVVGHGIPADTIARTRAAVIAWFDQPGSVKEPLRISRDNYRGFIPARFFSANSGELAADNYEGYKLHSEIDADDPICSACDLYGPNKWPAGLPAFKAAILDYWCECDRVASILLSLLALILGIDKSQFLSLFEKPLTNMTLLHYPPADADCSQHGIHPHKDTDALTILAPDPVGGLMVRRPDRAEWIAAEPPGDALVVNIGDLLELWSGGYFVSTPHKVVNNRLVSRYSFPYFVVPRYDTVVRSLVPTQAGFQRVAVHVGDVSREVWRTNWPDTVPADSQFELGTLQD